MGHAHPCCQPGRHHPRCKHAAEEVLSVQSHKGVGQGKKGASVRLARSPGTEAGTGPRERQAEKARQRLAQPEAYCA